MAIDRAVNMATRVTGIGEVERDFKKIGQAGEASFDQVGKAANDAGRKLSEYEKRVERAGAAAEKAFDRMIQRDPKLLAARLDNPEKFNQGLGQARSDFVLDAQRVERNAISEGLPETTQALDQLYNSSERAGGSLGRFALIGALAAGGLKLIADGVLASVDAFLEHEAAIDKFEAELALLGNRSEATGQQIRDMADEITASSRQSNEAALQGARQLAQVSGLTTEAFEEALAASAAYADAIGAELPDVIQGTTAPILQALAEQDMPALFKATEGLNDELRVLILRLAEGGDTAGAQQALIQGLADAAGNNPDSLANATDRASKAWDGVKSSLGEAFGDVAADGLDWLSGKLENFTSWVRSATAGWSVLKQSTSSGLGGTSDPVDPNFRATSLLAPRVANPRAELDRFRQQYGGGSQRPSTRGNSSRSRPSSRTDNSAEREAERAKRESERARQAADKIVISNDEVIASYQLRAREAAEKIGLEGEALAAVERQHEIEAAVRRINTEYIEKEIDARRKAAAVAGEEFNEANERAAATALIAAQSDAVRELAEDLADTNEELAEFALRQAQAQTVLTAIETPMQAFERDLQAATVALKDGALGADDFNAYMDLMAQRLADIRYETDKTAQAWAGFGDQVSGTLVDFAVNGGDALDVLQRLLGLTLERQLDQMFGNPLADFIDGLTGNNRADNVAAAQGELATAEQVLRSSATVGVAADGAAVSLNAVQQNALGAAQALGLVSATAGTEIDLLASESTAAAQAMGGLVPITGQFGGVLAQVLAQISGGGSGVGGWLGLAGSLLTGALGGGGGGSGAAAGGSGGGGNFFAGLFADGGTIPRGKFGIVGEAGPELAYAGFNGLGIMSNRDSRRLIGNFGEGSRGDSIRPRITTVTIPQTFMIPERADPRRTASTVSRAAQGGIARATRKGLAAGISR